MQVLEARWPAVLAMLDVQLRLARPSTVPASGPPQGGSPRSGTASSNPGSPRARHQWQYRRRRRSQPEETFSGIRLPSSTHERHGLIYRAHECSLQIPRTAGKFAKASEQGDLLPSQLHVRREADAARAAAKQHKGHSRAPAHAPISPRLPAPPTSPRMPPTKAGAPFVSAVPDPGSPGSTQGIPRKLFAVSTIARLSTTLPSAPPPPSLGLRLWGRAQQHANLGGGEEIDDNGPAGGTAFDALREARRQALKEEARERLQVLKEINSKEVVSARTRADEAADGGRWRRCEEALSEALKLADDDEGLLSYRSLALLRQGQAERALADADRAITSDPSSARAHYRRARALAEQQRHAESGQAMVDALSRSPRTEAARHLDAAMTNIRRDRGFYSPGEVVRLGALKDCRPARPYSFHAASDAQRARGSQEAVTPLHARWEGDQVDALLVTPVPRPTRPPPCSPPSIDPDTVTASSLRVTWAPMSSSCEPPCEPPPSLYVVEIAEVDPLLPTSLDYEEIYSGPPTCWGLSLYGLEPDTEYAFRVYCANIAGASEVGAATRVSTLPPPEPPKSEVRMPRSWQRELNSSPELNLLLDKLQKSHGDLKAEAFEELLELVDVHCALLRRLCKFYSLLGSDASSVFSSSEGDTLTLSQFRLLVRDCCIDVLPDQADRVKLDKGEINEAFSLARRSHAMEGGSGMEKEAEGVSHGGEGAAGEPEDEGADVDDHEALLVSFKPHGTSRRGGAASHKGAATGGAHHRAAASSAAGLPQSSSSRTESEVVHALCRLAVLRARAKGKAGEAGWPGSTSRETCKPYESFVACAFDVMMHECVEKYGEVNLQDELTPILSSRGVRAVLRKHANALSSQFKRWASFALSPEDSADSMTLYELLVSLKEACLLDGDRVTAKMVTKAFVIANAADFAKEAAYNKRGSGDANASALEYDEWCELICRICDAKTGGARAEAAAIASGTPSGAATTDQSTEAPPPFDKMLDTWLSLVLLPSLRNAATDRVPPAPDDQAARARQRMEGAVGTKKASNRRKSFQVVLATAKGEPGADPDHEADDADLGEAREGSELRDREDEDLYHWPGFQG